MWRHPQKANFEPGKTLSGDQKALLHFNANTRRTTHNLKLKLGLI